MAWFKRDMIPDTMLEAVSLAAMMISTRLFAMLLPVYLIGFILLLVLCIAVFPKWVLIGVPILLALSALAEKANRKNGP